MRLLVFEGYNDLQFFRSFLNKQMGSKVITKENKNLIDQFKNLLAENPEMAKIEVMSLNDCRLILLSVGSKDNFKVLAEGIKPLINVLKREGQNINSILFVADKDAKAEVIESERTIREKLKNDAWKINVRYILYNDYLEDLVLELVNMIKLQVDTRLLENLLKIIEEGYANDRYIQKRKVSIIHAVIGPRCFGHLFDEIFNFFDNPEQLLRHIDVLSKFTDWLMEKV